MLISSLDSAEYMIWVKQPHSKSLFSYYSVLTKLLLKYAETIKKYRSLTFTHVVCADRSGLKLPLPHFWLQNAAPMNYSVCL